MICRECNLDKPRPEFRSKTTGPMRGYVFSICIQCEGENHLERIATTTLRAAGYTCTAPFVVKQEPPPDPPTGTAEVKP